MRRVLNIFLFTFGIIVAGIAQTLIEANVVENSGVRVFNPNGIIFQANDGQIKHLSLNETLTSLHAGRVLFEFNGLVYSYNASDDIIRTIDPTNLSEATFFNDSDINIFSADVHEFSSEFYFVGLENGVVKFYRLDANGDIISTYLFPDNIQNFYRIHSANGKVYVHAFSNVPISENFYYEFDPTSAIVTGISVSSYPTYPSRPDYSQFTVNGETYSINNIQLTSDLNPVELTCFEFGTGEYFGTAIIGPIGNRIYLSYDSQFGGSTPGIYRYPEGSDSSLCPDNVCQNDDVIVELHIEIGDVYLDEACRGIVMKNPNGDCFRMSVDNNGELITQSVTCPN